MSVILSIVLASFLFWIYLLIRQCKGECQQIMDGKCMIIHDYEYAIFSFSSATRQ